MAEGLAVDFSSFLDIIHPKTAMGLLFHIRDAFDDKLDHEFLDDIWNVIKRCEIPDIIRGSKMVLQETHRMKACDLKKSVWGVLEGSIVVLGMLVMRMSNDGCNSPGMEWTMENKLSDTIKILNKLKEAARASGFPDHEIWAVEEDIHVLLSLFNYYIYRQHPFQKTPPLSNLCAPLWSKLRKISFQELMEKAKIDSCCVCLEALNNIDFAILDNCPHLMCTKCAHRILSNPDVNMRRCPMCRSEVLAYTSAANFARFKASTSFKCRAWKLLNSIKTSVFKGS